MTLTDSPAPHVRHQGFVPVSPRAGQLRPLGSDEVKIRGGFWAHRQAVNARNTFAHINHWLEREGWIPNFDLAASGALPHGRRGREFADSEVYKFLEGLAWEIGRNDSQQLDDLFRSVVARVAAAQDDDGYLNTNFGRLGQASRWSDLEWGHELYCLGHLFQAAVARGRTRPDADDGLLTVATRAADLVCHVFGPGGIERVCGHAEVETGLAELGRLTQNPRYGEQAALFIERRGNGSLGQIEWGQQYFQDDLPIREAAVLRGHAVRANYLSAGAVDVAVDIGDTTLLAALSTQWRNTIARRTYLTGGQGSHHQDEAFGDDFVLPPDRAYSETCAGIASIMFSWRLALALGDAAYSDLVERTLYNVVATSPSATGTAFYYANTLHQRSPGAEVPPDVISPRAESSMRAPWFEVACCPPNVARTLASLDCLVATVDANGLQLHQFASSTIRTKLDDGRSVAIDVETDYPHSGVVRLTIVADVPGQMGLSVRVPQWASDAQLRVLPAGEPETTRSVTAGWAKLSRQFRKGDVVELVLPLSPRVVYPDSRIDAVRGCVAVERGPEVLALESVDLATATNGAVDDVAVVRIDAKAPVIERDGQAYVRLAVTSESADEPWPYATENPEPREVSSVVVPLIPYHSWAERGPSTMRIWLPVHPDMQEGVK